MSSGEKEAPERRKRQVTYKEQFQAPSLCFPGPILPCFPFVEPALSSLNLVFSLLSMRDQGQLSSALAQGPREAEEAVPL